MKKMIFTAILLTLFGSMFFAGCSSDGDSPTSTPVITPTAIVQISGTNTLKVGESATLTATVSPAQDNPKYTWTLNDSSRADIVSSGNKAEITAKSAGTLAVTVTVAGASRTHYISISESDKPKAGLTLNTTSVQTAKDDTFTLTATVTNLTGKTVSWETSDATVASLSATSGDNVIVTTKKDGSATITAKVDSVQATCAVAVKTTETVGGSTLWRADAYGSDTYTSATTLGLMTILATDQLATGQKDVATVSGAKVGEYSFNTGLDLKGAADWRVKDETTGETVSYTVPTYRALKFTLDASAKITVYARANSDTNERNVMLHTGTSATSLGRTSTTAAAFSTPDYIPAGTYYIHSSNSGITIYAVDIQSSGSGQVITYVYPSAVSLNKSTLELDASTSSTAKEQLTATIANASAVSAGLDTLVWASSNANVATVSSAGLVTGKAEGTATITVTTINGKTATCAVTVDGEPVVREGLNLDDAVPGYASLGTYNTTATPVIVKTRTELKNAIKNAGVIVIDGMIDMSDGMIPATGGGTTEKLDELVKSTTSGKYTTYTAFRDAYAASCTAATEGDSPLDSTLSELNSAYGSVISVSLKSNTTLIGKGENCGIKGGAISISGVSNVQVRNLVLQDAYDPFPHHENNDGFNAQHDNICVSGTSKNIWIDHCTLEDTMGLVYVTIQGGSEKWQTYDGLLDMKDGCTNITISNCKFYNHDKTMLIGSSDSNGDNTKRFITLYQNWFQNCGQRLPMVRNTTIHILNNYYDAATPMYGNSYAVGVRKNAIIYAEANYFGNGINQSFANSYGQLYSSGNNDNSKAGCKSTVTGSTLFSTAVNAYPYTATTAEAAKATAQSSAGANKKFNL